MAKNISERFCQITSSSEWKLAKTIKLNFPTFHPQGMLKIGDFYFLSAVQTIVKPQKYNSLQNGYYRSTGKGIGHLFTFNESGDLIAQANLGDSITYHPGGIDFDGKYIWAPVSEYRPNSRSLIYRIDPATLNFEQIFPFNDSIGALACD